MLKVGLCLLSSCKIVQLQLEIFIKVNKFQSVTQVWVLIIVKIIEHKESVFAFQRTRSLFTHIVGCVAKENLKTQLSSRGNINFVILKKLRCKLDTSRKTTIRKISKIIHVHTLTSQHFLSLTFSARFEISKSKPVKFAQ